MEDQLVGGRSRGEIYRVSGRADLHEYLLGAVEASGGRILYASDPSRAPVFLGVQLDTDERMGLLVYPFRVTRNVIAHRPSDEVRGQMRYGGEKSWQREHPIGRDIAGVDVSLIVGIDIADNVLIGLDAHLWDPLPMGISFYAKQADIDEARSTGWHVWEKENRGGKRRSEPRSPTHFETMVAFEPDRFIDFAKLERRSTALRLDPSLRFAAARAMAHSDRDAADLRHHVLETQFDLSSRQILDIIGGRNRLAVAVRGGVAEYHLEALLRADPDVRSVDRLDADAMHDFDVTLANGTRLRVECKNASPKTSASGDYKVEVQKTRPSMGDPASRFYPVDGFDVVAACLFSATGRWAFRYGATKRMARHKTYPDRLAPIQMVDDTWTASLSALSFER